MDRRVVGSLPSGMARRNVFDPLEPTQELRWYVVRDRLGRVLEARQLPPGTDLKRILLAAMLERIDNGWGLGEFGSRGGSCFCVKGTERCQVAIEAADPGRPVRYGAAHLTWSPQQPSDEE